MNTRWHVTVHARDSGESHMAAKGKGWMVTFRGLGLMWVTKKYTMPQAIPKEGCTTGKVFAPWKQP